MDEKVTNMPGFNQRIQKIELWIENHQKTSIKHTVYLGLLALSNVSVVLYLLLKGI